MFGASKILSFQLFIAQNGIAVLGNYKVMLQKSDEK